MEVKVRETMTHIAAFTFFKENTKIFQQNINAVFYQTKLRLSYGFFVLNNFFIDQLRNFLRKRTVCLTFYFRKVLMYPIVSLRFILRVCVKSRALLPRTTNNLLDHIHRASRAKPDNISL